METSVHELDKIAISVKSHKLLKQLLNENPPLKEIMQNARNDTEALVGVRNWVLEELKKNPDAYRFYKREVHGRKAFDRLNWHDYAAIRILDYVDHAGREFDDLGENISEYESIWGYSMGETEPRMPLYEYPEYEFKVTDKYTNLGPKI